MSFDVSVLLLRFGILALLYLFLLQVVVVIGRELRQPARAAGGGRAGVAPLARLIVDDPGKSGLATGEVLTLGPVTSLGRGPGNAIRLADDFVSAQHALISARDRQWWIEDLGSTNGTFVNRRQVDRSLILSHGDLVEIGGVQLRFDRGGQTG